MAEFTEDQISEIADCLSIFDRVGDGQINDNQIVQALQALGLNPLAADVNKVIADSDLKGKRVSLEQFVSIYKQLSKQSPQLKFEDFNEGIKTFDREQNGLISAAELRHIIANLGETVPEDSLDILMEGMEDANGFVNYGAFIKHVLAG